MTQEDKEILLKDLCARLPYGVKGIIEGGDVVTTPLKWYAEQSLELSINYMVVKNGWRPYLLPLSSMTKKQRYELHDLIHNLNVLAINGEIGDWIVSSSEIDWYNKNHFDYRGLIPKGLAIDATGLNIY